MKKFTKVLFGFGTIVAVVAPLSATIACDGLKDDYEDEFKVEKTATRFMLSDNEWLVTLKKDVVSEDHLLDVLKDKLWTNRIGSIGNKITIKDKGGKEILSFEVLAINSTTYNVFLLRDEIKNKLNDAKTNSNAQQYFS